MREPQWLLDTARDVHSQSGEDGIIEAILSVLPVTDGWCVEFGAWDGEHLSNTAHLIESRDYSAVLIEGDAARHALLATRCASNPKIHTRHRFVGFEQDDNLDVILADTPIPHDFDLLSIDIDGNDYHAWNATNVYRPKVVCIEYNPTIPTEVAWVQPADPALTQGASIAALAELGRNKGYELVCIGQWNLFFVLADLFPLFEIEDNSPAALRGDAELVIHVFVGYDGTVLTTGGTSLPWHNVSLSPRRFQQLPRVFRHFPANYGRVRLLAFRAYRVLRDPAIARRKLRRR